MGTSIHRDRGEGGSYEPGEHGVLFCAAFPRTRVVNQVRDSVYPPCTSLGRIRCFWRISRLIESVTYASSTPLLVRSPPPLPNPNKPYPKLVRQFHQQEVVVPILSQRRERMANGEK